MSYHIKQWYGTVQSSSLELLELLGLAHSTFAIICWLSICGNQRYCTNLKAFQVISTHQTSGVVIRNTPVRYLQPSPNMEWIWSWPSKGKTIDLKSRRIWYPRKTIFPATSATFKGEPWRSLNPPLRPLHWQFAAQNLNLRCAPGDWTIRFTTKKKSSMICRFCKREPTLNLAAVKN